MSEEQTNSDQTPTRKSRRLFWTLMIATLSVAFTPLFIYGYRYHRRMELIERIGIMEDAGIFINSTAPEWLRNILGNDLIRGFDTVDSVEDYSGRIGIRELSVFPEIRDLDLHHAHTDQLIYLRNFESLEQLWISSPPLSDGDLSHIARLQHLKELGIAYQPSDVTGLGVELISKLPDLETLELFAPNVTDEGLKHLEHFRHLKWLDLYDSQVTDEGLKELQRCLPNCNVAL